FHPYHIYTFSLSCLLIPTPHDIYPYNIITLSPVLPLLSFLISISIYYNTCYMANTCIINTHTTFEDTNITCSFLFTIEHNQQSRREVLKFLLATTSSPTTSFEAYSTGGF
ncbi:hypothetical protein CFOL_v3_21218, partial [Cephalotus follicularis]